MIQSVQNVLQPDIERRLAAKKRIDDMAVSTLLENINILEKSLTVGPWADVKNDFTWKIIIVLKVRDGHSE